MRRARSRALALVLVTSFAWCTPRDALAGGPELVVAEGSGLDAAKLRTHVAVELVGDEGPVQIEVSRVAGRTRGAVHVRLAFADGTTEERDLALTDVADAEVPRVLALAIAEASRAHALGPKPPPAPIVGPPPAPVLASPATPRPASPPARIAHEAAFHVGAEVALGARVYGLVGTLVVEPRLGAFVRHTSGARADLAFAYQTASAGDPLGRVTAHAFVGSLGASYERALSPRLSLRLGPRLDLGGALGSAVASGEARESSASALVVGLVGELAGRLRLSESFAVLAALDAGGMFRGLSLTADQRTPVALGGAMFGARLGVAFD